MPSNRERQALLVESLIASFDKLDDMTVFEKIDPIGWQLVTAGTDQYGFRQWTPLKTETATSALDPLYAKLPAPFPRLFERLVLSYRWAEVDLQSYTLLANPPGPDLSGLLREMSRDPHLWKALLPAGYVPFGRGPDVEYDPVCFDIKSRKKNRDYSVVKIDHEEILCNDRIRVVAELAPSFEELVRRTIVTAANTKRRQYDEEC